jgi:hypothetical protein
MILFSGRFSSLLLTIEPVLVSQGVVPIKLGSFRIMAV